MNYQGKSGHQIAFTTHRISSNETLTARALVFSYYMQKRSTFILCYKFKCEHAYVHRHNTHNCAYQYVPMPITS